MDVIYDLDLGISDTPSAVSLTGQTKKLDDIDAFTDLLEPIFKKGKCVQKPKSIHEVRREAITEVELFYRFHGENPYSVGLEKKLFEKKQELIEFYRGA